MKVLVIGSGGREHALAWRLRQSAGVEEVIVDAAVDDMDRRQTARRVHEPLVVLDHQVAALDQLRTHLAGKENMLAAFQEVVDTDDYEMSWKPTKAVVSASNDMAYAYGTLELKLPGSEPVAGKYVVVWVKENGEWRLAIDIPNLDA